MERGLVQVYTGEGKGKTTAAIGLGIRAVGSGNKVCMVQFLKSFETGELSTLKRLYPDFQVFRFEKKRGFFWNLNEEEKAQLKEEVQKAFLFACEAAKSSQYDVLILDEIMGALKNHLLTVDEVAEFIRNKPQDMELVLTGRNVPEEIAGLADYISCIKAVKHPIDQGIGARKGIEY